MSLKDRLKRLEAKLQESETTMLMLEKTEAGWKTWAGYEPFEFTADELEELRRKAIYCIGADDDSLVMLTIKRGDI